MRRFNNIIDKMTLKGDDSIISVISVLIIFIIFYTQPGVPISMLFQAGGSTVVVTPRHGLSHILSFLWKEIQIPHAEKIIINESDPG